MEIKSRFIKKNHLQLRGQQRRTLEQENWTCWSKEYTVTDTTQKMVSQFRRNGRIIDKSVKFITNENNQKQIMKVTTPSRQIENDRYQISNRVWETKTEELRIQLIVNRITRIEQNNEEKRLSQKQQINDIFHQT